MQQANKKPESENTNEALSISLLDIVNFLKDAWKQIGIAAMIGSIIGTAGWAVSSTYKAESVLINNGALTFMSWRGLQKNLTLLAAQLLETQRVNEDEITQYRYLANPTWWQKNVVPTYSLTKADTKDLANISKDLQESGGTNILNLVVTAKGSSKSAAENNAEITTRFIKQGSAYLSIKHLINSYESQVLSSDSDLQRKILDAEIELKFMRERAKNLETLRSRFPANAVVGNQQVLDIKDANAKFMPISTQIVANNSDINNTTEALQRMKDQLEQIKTMKSFVVKALPLIEIETNGIALADRLLEVEANMRSELASNEVNSIQVLNTIQSSIVTMRTSFSKGLDNNLSSMVTRSNPALAMLGGLVAGALCTVLFLLGKTFFIRINTPHKAAPSTNNA